MPGSRSNAEVRFRLLCYNNPGPKLEVFGGWAPGRRALVSGHILFSGDPKDPLELIVKTIEPNIPQDMYCNSVVLGNAFFGNDEIKTRKNGQLAVKIGTTLDNSDVTTWLHLETDPSRGPKLAERVRKGRALCAQGYLREYRKDDDESPYRAIVADDFTTRKDYEKPAQGGKERGSAVGYAEADPTPTLPGSTGQSSSAGAPPASRPEY